MKALLTSYSEGHGYNTNSLCGPSIDVDFITQLPSKFHCSQLELRFRDLDHGSLGIARDSSLDDEWEVEIKLTRKPKPQSQTFHFK